MDVREAATDLLGRMNEGPRILLGENQLKRRLDQVYDRIDVIMMETDSRIRDYCQFHRLLLVHNPPPAPKATHQDLSNLYYEVQALSGRIEQAIAINEVFWEVYDVLIEAEPELMQSRKQLENKDRTSKGPNERNANRRFLLGAKQRVTQLLQDISDLKIEQFEEEPSAILQRLDDIQSQLENIKDFVFSNEEVPTYHMLCR
ncbi:hypothetical protein Q1695_008609 [Nippostrongylus brasiliensis]|nr:hypothetical protein Q1695_008609 [Nippostrongylus brasiliensis]